MASQKDNYEPPFVVALDVGSSSIRAMVFDSDGRQIEGLQTEVEHHTKTTHDGGAVFDADAIAQRTIECVAALQEKKAFRHCRKRVAAVGCSMFMHSLVGTDRAGHACTPLYTWSDTRSRDTLAGSRLDRKAIHQRTGCPLHTSYPLAKLLWLRREQSGLFRRAHCWLSMGDYLYLQLFGRPTLSLSMASGSGLLDFRKLQWDATLLRTVGIREGQLGELVDCDDASNGPRGKFRRALGCLAGVPWFPAMGDAVCSNIGSDCVDDSRFALNLGTSGAMRSMFRRVPSGIPDGLFCYRVDRQRLLLGGAISNCGNLRRWLLHTMQLGRRAEMDSALARMSPDSHGLTMLPFLAGERAPLWPNDATGAILGLRSATTPSDIARAGCDAVCYQLTMIHERLTYALPRAKKIVVSGGGSSTDWWMQMMADTMNTPVQLSLVKEASSRGAALLALEALGIHGTTTSKSGKTYGPNAHRGQVYRRALQRYKELCDQWSKQ
ncbi:MAG: carbohydrate kinase [Pedosphaera sp.]|nr:carbohydrate kinase [Pedosphaera sp.]